MTHFLRIMLVTYYLAFSVLNLLEPVLFRVTREKGVCVRARMFVVYMCNFAFCNFESIYLPTSFPIVCDDFFYPFFLYRLSILFPHEGA